MRAALGCSWALVCEVKGKLPQTVHKLRLGVRWKPVTCGRTIFCVTPSCKWSTKVALLSLATQSSPSVSPLLSSTLPGVLTTLHAPYPSQGSASGCSSSSAQVHSLIIKWLDNQEMKSLIITVADHQAFHHVFPNFCNFADDSLFNGRPVGVWCIVGEDDIRFLFC